MVRTIGKNRFEQIPLIEDFFHIKGLTFEDSLEPIMWYYLRDSSFPSIVRGETVSGAKYLLLHTQNMDKETNEPYGESHIFIHSEENTLRVWQQTKFSNISAMTSCSTGVITNEIIEKLQDLISTGAYTKSKGT